MYTDWMRRVQKKARITLKQRREATNTYNDKQATPQPDIKICDLVILNAKNIQTKQPTKKLTQ